KKGELLGSGAYGRVYLGFNEEDGTFMAAKQIPLAEYPPGEADAIVAGMEREIGLMARLQHDNIVQYIGSQRESSSTAAGKRNSMSSGGDDDVLTIFMEYIPGGSLASLIHRFGCLNEQLVRMYTRQILQGLAYLHAHTVVHRDIKGANILVDRSGVCKVSDFGASKFLAALDNTAATASGPDSLRGTPAFMAPEVIKQVGYGRSSDIWSLAGTVVEMLTGRPAFAQFDSPVAAMFAIASGSAQPHIPSTLSDEGKDFLRACFQRDPAARPTAAQLLRHPFIVGPSLAGAACKAAASTPGVNNTPGSLSITSGSPRRADVASGDGAEAALPRASLAIAPAPFVMPPLSNSGDLFRSAGGVRTPSHSTAAAGSYDLEGTRSACVFFCERYDLHSRALPSTGAPPSSYAALLLQE
ncbi:MAG: hypothetical protein EOO65_05055, partial [Methanosarcinales archaeon]